MDAATPASYTLSLHDALPISSTFNVARQLTAKAERAGCPVLAITVDRVAGRNQEDRKSTRLNSSHLGISYAVFCLKKKNTTHPARHVLTPQRRRRRTRLKSHT